VVGVLGVLGGGVIAAQSRQAGGRGQELKRGWGAGGLGAGHKHKTRGRKLNEKGMKKYEINKTRRTRGKAGEKKGEDR